MNLTYLDYQGNERTFNPSMAETRAIKADLAYIDDSHPYPCVRYYRDKIPGAQPQEASPPAQYKDGSPSDWVDYKAIGVE